MRNDPFTEGEYYHIFNRSIAGFKIFNDKNDFDRFIDLATYYQYRNRPTRYSFFNELSVLSQKSIIDGQVIDDQLVSIVCYCIMPTHFHMLLKQSQENGITKFLGLIENSYSRFFNIKHKRKGPLWESRFKGVHIKTDEQLQHLTRYIHLNPSSAGLVKKPEDWSYSSYSEYLGKNKTNDICEFNNIINISPKEYKNFVNDRKSYQHQLSIIKSQLIDSYTG